MALEPRDERFIEFAVASGHLDRTLAHRLTEIRQATISGDAIEQFVVRQGFLRPEAVQAIIVFARDSATQHESVQLATYADANTFAPRVTADDSTQKDPSAAKPARGLGTRFGAYEILGELGRGGMGAVYRARKDGSQDVVALKVLVDEKNANDATTRRFDREIRAGRDIDHPNVVKVFDAGQVDGRLFFTMEFIEGRSFDKVIPELALRQKIEIFEKIARAVNQAHARGYIHRDLKPQNIMITKDNEPKVADFGLAKSLDRESRLTKTGAILGTIAYMSPEQAEGGGAHKLDGRTDIYSLGAILYQLICGTVPFKSATQYGTIGLILTQDPDPPTAVDPSCPPALSAIALKALEKEREKRFQTAAELADEIGRWLHGTKVATAAPTIGDKLAKGVKRRRLPIAAVLLTIAVAVATMGILALKHRRERQALLAETTQKLDALLAEVAKPGSTAELADRLEALDSKLQSIPELAARQPAVKGLALIARSLERERPAAEAKPLVEAALVVAPARWDVRRAFVNVLERLGEPAEAARSIEAAPERPPEANELLGLARLELGDVIGAKAAFQAAGSKPLLARALALLGDPQAVELAKALPGSEEASLLLQEARLATERGEAIDALRLIERNKKTPEVELRIAQALLRIERGAEARSEFARALAYKASPRDCKEGEAEALLLEGRPIEAARALDEAAQLAPAGSFARARLLARKARVHVLAGKPATREALSERPNDPYIQAAFATEDAALLEKLAPGLGTHPAAIRAWCALARIREKAGDAAGAKAAREKALAIDPEDEEALAADPAKARAAFAKGRGDGARLFRAALTAWSIAETWKRDEDRERAETLLACAERAAPWAGAPQVERGRRLLAQGPTARPAAKDALERGLALVPDDATGLVCLAGLVDPPRAEELCTRALALLPRHARALALRGKARLDQKRPQEALPDLDASLDADRHDADAWAWKVAALDALGKPNDAVRREAEDRRNALAVAARAIHEKDYTKALDFAPDAPEIVLAAVDALFQGNVAIEEPLIVYTKMIPLQPAKLLNGVFDRTAVEAIHGDLADRYEGADADASSLFTAFVIRGIEIFRQRDLRPETLRKARVAVERCLAKDPAHLIALGGRGLILALERQTDLAREDLARTQTYAPGVHLFTFAQALVRAHSNEDPKPLVEELSQKRRGDKILHDWLVELLKGVK